jgi:hypothetical protein
VALIQKQYFRLDEVAHVLGLSGSDIIYLAENGQMRLSIRVFGLVVVNAGVNLQQFSGVKVQHGRRQEGSRYIGGLLA